MRRVWSREAESAERPTTNDSVSTVTNATTVNVTSTTTSPQDFQPNNLVIYISVGVVLSGITALLAWVGVKYCNCKRQSCCQKKDSASDTRLKTSSRAKEISLDYLRRFKENRRHEKERESQRVSMHPLVRKFIGRNSIVGLGRKSLKISTRTKRTAGAGAGAGGPVLNTSRDPSIHDYVIGENATLHQRDASVSSESPSGRSGSDPTKSLTPRRPSFERILALEKTWKNWFESKNRKVVGEENRNKNAQMEAMAKGEDRAEETEGGRRDETKEGDRDEEEGDRDEEEGKDVKEGRDDESEEEEEEEKVKETEEKHVEEVPHDGKDRTCEDDDSDITVTWSGRSTDTEEELDDDADESKLFDANERR